MRIVHVIPGLTQERGGPSSVLEALVRHQAEAGHQVVVLTTDQGARSGECPMKVAGSVEVDRLKVRGPDRLSYAPGFAAAARARLRECDVVHAHSLFTYPIHAALREALALGLPAVLRPCGQLHRYSLRRSALKKQLYLALWGRRVRRACSAWHYTSENESAESWPFDASPRFILPNGIEPAEYSMERGEARRQVARTWPALADAPYVLFLGRLHPKKRVDLLLEAFLAGAPTEMKLVVAGPDECGLWDDLARHHGNQEAVARRIVRLGMVGGRDKVALLTAARCFALPSEHENFGVAALEALAAGTPALLSPHVDLAPAAESAELSRTVPLELATWRDALASLTADAADDFTGRARAWVERHYSWKRIAAALLDRYRTLSRGDGAFSLSHHQDRQQCPQ